MGKLKPQSRRCTKKELEALVVRMKKEIVSLKLQHEAERIMRERVEVKLANVLAEPPWRNDR